MILWVSTDSTNIDQKVTLTDVLYVPDFNVNLMSVRKLAQAGYGFTVMGDTAQLLMADETPFAVVLGTRRDDLYVLTARTSKTLSCPANAGSYHSAIRAGGERTVCLSAMSDAVSVQTARQPRDVTPLHLMHDRLNHLNVQQMVQMRTSDMVEGAQALPSSVPSSAAKFTCESCIIGKSHRSNMLRKSSAPRTTRVLQLVHSDVCGPVRVASLQDDFRYVVTFVDGGG